MSNIEGVLAPSLSFTYFEVPSNIDTGRIDPFNVMAHNRCNIGIEMDPEGSSKIKRSFMKNILLRPPFGGVKTFQRHLECWAESSLSLQLKDILFCLWSIMRTVEKTQCPKGSRASPSLRNRYRGNVSGIVELGWDGWKIVWHHLYSRTLEIRHRYFLRFIKLLVRWYHTINARAQAIYLLCYCERDETFQQVHHAEVVFKIRCSASEDRILKAHSYFALCL